METHILCTQNKHCQNHCWETPLLISGSAEGNERIGRPIKKSVKSLLFYSPYSFAHLCLLCTLYLALFLLRQLSQSQIRVIRTRIKLILGYPNKAQIRTMQT